MNAGRLQRVLATNVIGPFLGAREAIKRMSTSHGGHGGAIVNVSSAAARLGSPGEYVDYARPVTDGSGAGSRASRKTLTFVADAIHHGQSDEATAPRATRPDRGATLGAPPHTVVGRKQDRREFLTHAPTKPSTCAAIVIALPQTNLLPLTSATTKGSLHLRLAPESPIPPLTMANSVHRWLYLLGGLLVSCTSSTTTNVAGDGDGGNAGSAGATATTAVGGSGGHTGTTSANESGGVGGAPASTGTKDATQELTCTGYCRAVLNNCTGDTTRQYKSDESCMRSCAAFRLGSKDSLSGNTLACRAAHAMLAEQDPALHCSSAGPAGAGVCGTNCEGYCALMMTICPAAYEDETVCRSACLPMTGVGADRYAVGGTGDNLQCRLYHVTFAAEGFPEMHCPHASASPTAPCAN